MISLEKLKKLFSYCEDTGLFKSLKTGDVVGTKHKSGYVRIYTQGRSYYAHRLAWLYVHGVMPDVIDHLNGNEEDNRISNLFNADMAFNAKNRRKYKSNSTGVPGVYFDRDHNKYRARLGFGKNAIHIGYYSDLQDAKKAIIEARALNGYPEQR